MFKYSSPQASHGTLEKSLCVSVLHPHHAGSAWVMYDVTRCLDSRLTEVSALGKAGSLGQVWASEDFGHAEELEQGTQQLLAEYSGELAQTPGRACSPERCCELSENPVIQRQAPSWCESVAECWSPESWGVSGCGLHSGPGTPAIANNIVIIQLLTIK